MSCHVIHERLRQRWIAGGMRWWEWDMYVFWLNERWNGVPPVGVDSASARPSAGWEPVAQLGPLFRQLDSQPNDAT